MMKYLIVGMIAITILSLVYDIVSKNKDKKIYEQLTNLIITKQFDKFDEIIDLPQTRKRFPQFNHLFLKLNKEMLVGNIQKAESLMEQLNDIKLTVSQKEAFYSKAFYYAIAKEDYAMATKYHDSFMESCKNNREELDRVYDTIVAKGYKYLDASLAELKEANQTTKIQLYSLISTMYENKGDSETGQKYLNKLKEEINSISKK